MQNVNKQRKMWTKLQYKKKQHCSCIFPA